jgi:hypothetical protein
VNAYTDEKDQTVSSNPQLIIYWTLQLVPFVLSFSFYKRDFRVVFICIPHDCGGFKCGHASDESTSESSARGQRENFWIHQILSYTKPHNIQTSHSTIAGSEPPEDVAGGHTSNPTSFATPPGTGSQREPSPIVNSEPDSPEEGSYKILWTRRR